MSSMNITECATLVSAAFAGISALVAAMALRSSWQSQANQKLLEQAQLSLERAYEALTDGGANIAPPRADRLNWLTAARHIQRYKALRSKITDKTHQVICDEQEEYWRHRFYLVLDCKQLLQPTYYGRRRTAQKMPIEPTSAVIVHAFAKWPESKSDPIKGVDTKKLIASTKLLEGKPGLRGFLEHMDCDV